MKQNETTGQNELESVNSELFQSFDPDDTSWIIGGKVIYCIDQTVDSSGKYDNQLDIML